jgi:hypothetical protein
LAADKWQAEFIGSYARRVLTLCSRQCGKSTCAAAVAVRTAILEPPALVLVLSPSERQSAEFMVKVRAFYNALRMPRKKCAPALEHQPRRLADMPDEEAMEEAWRAIPDKERESALQLHLRGGSRIIGLPASPATILGYSGVNLLLIDEAARVPDELYRAVRPMLAVSKGRLICLSTPKGKRGWFHDEFVSDRQWQRFRINADHCPRIDPAFLAEERAALGDRFYGQEYFTEWTDIEDAYFSGADLERLQQGPKAGALPWE